MYVPTRSPQRKRLRTWSGTSVSCGLVRLMRKGRCHQTRALYSTSSVRTWKRLLNRWWVRWPPRSGIWKRSWRRKIVEKEVRRAPRTTTCGRSEKGSRKTSKEGTRRPRTPTDGNDDPSLHRCTYVSDGRAKGTVHSWSGYYEALGFWEPCSSWNRIYGCGYTTYSFAGFPG